MTISITEYKNLVKQERETFFKQPYDLIYDTFVELGYKDKDNEYFLHNASEILETVRDRAWNDYLPIEKDFMTNMLTQLVDEDIVNQMTPIEAISWFASEFSEHIYALTLSNTQSRRVRAGKEFEAIIELILMGADIPMDTQGNIGKKVFTDKGLGKLVDIVCPNVVEFIKNKRNTILISAKTTLRERWQEVPEEMARTGAREMFLITIDENISNNVLDTIYENNIQLVTTKRIKENLYNNNIRILSFEELLQICNNHKERWTFDFYTANDKVLVTHNIDKQQEKQCCKEFVYNYYTKRKSELE